jgi:putative ABC transport system substrate-binding protein
VDRILRGARPAAMPVQFATKFELAYNLAAVRAIGLEVPTELFSRADARI